MEYKTLALDEKRPRNVDLIRKALPLYDGVRPFYFFGVFALIAPLIPLVFMIVNSPKLAMGWGPIAFSIFAFELIAFLLLFQGNSIYQRRLKALVEGIEVEGTVIKQGRNFVFWKSARNYNLTIEFEHQGKKQQISVESPKNQLHLDFPEGSKIWGLYAVEKDAVCFPIEFGILLEPKNPAKKGKKNA
jgi:hypothetical protein